jgi:hypothetical protein
MELIINVMLYPALVLLTGNARNTNKSDVHRVLNSKVMEKIQDVGWKNTLASMT